MVVDSRPRKVEAMASKKTKPKKPRPKKTKSRKSSLSRAQSKVNLSAKGRAKKKKAAPKSKSLRRSQRGRADSGELLADELRERRASSGGQSGDTQGIAGDPDVDSESVEQLLEEGQSFEAEVVSGVENAPDPDESEVHTREVPEDDVPGEYRGKQ
jgi:hypothetical protein